MCLQTMGSTDASRNLTRRHFIRRASALAAGGLAAVASIGATPRSEARAPRQQSRAGKRPQRVAVVGAGDSVEIWNLDSWVERRKGMVEKPPTLPAGQRAK